MSAYKNKRRKTSRAWLYGQHGTLLLILLIIFAFPVGLYIMWDEADWKLWQKLIATAAWVLMFAAAIVTVTGISMKYDEGNIEILNVAENKLMLSPLQPSNVPVVSQLIKDASETSSLISQPTPTPVPTYVYCNDNGVNYHLAGCRYVYDKTPRVTLTQALNAGKTACKLCNPPTEETYE